MRKKSKDQDQQSKDPNKGEMIHIITFTDVTFLFKPVEVEIVKKIPEMSLLSKEEKEEKDKKKILNGEIETSLIISPKTRLELWEDHKNQTEKILRMDFGFLDPKFKLLYIIIKIYGLHFASFPD